MPFQQQPHLSHSLAVGSRQASPLEAAVSIGTARWLGVGAAARQTPRGRSDCRCAPGASKAELLADHYSPLAGSWEAHPLAPEIAAVAAGSFKRRHPPEIRGTGYVVQSLEAALWAFDQSQSFREGCLLAVNLGDDADTTGAMYGQLARAFYGAPGIPETWRATLAHRTLIASGADQLLELSRTLDDRHSPLPHST